MGQEVWVPEPMIGHPSVEILHAGAVAPAEAGRAALATKLLGAWLANRRQTLMPHTLNFRALAPAEVSLLIGMMAAAAQAGGAVGAAAERQAALALGLVSADPEEVRSHAVALDTPQPVASLLTGAQQAGIGAHAYAATLLAIDRTSPVSAAFLAYVAARLSLPPDLARALESRYRA